MTLPLLKKGDKIHIVAIGKVVTDTALSFALDSLHQAGFETVLGESLYQSDGYFAGSDGERAADLQVAINDPDCKAILFARGGYGASRIIDYLDFTALYTHPKWLCGFSDLTALILHLCDKRVPFLHSTMPILFQSDPLGSQALLQMLSGNTSEKYLFPSCPEDISGTTEGILTGGCLSLITHILATPSAPIWKGKILFIEETDEYLYHIDRMLVQLKRAGVLAQLSGIICGYFSPLKDTTPEFGMGYRDIIINHCSEYRYPIYFGAEAGHAIPNLPLKMNVPVRLTPTGTQVSLTYL